MLVLPVGVMIVILAIIIRAVDGFSPWYVQQRRGKNGTIFVCYKLQTMVPLEQCQATERTDGQRVTRLGSFLRNRGWDELPQIFNILEGSMHFFGPRPLPLNDFEKWRKQHGASRKEMEQWQVERAKHVPGLTGWQQIHQLVDVSGIKLDMETITPLKKLKVAVISVCIFFFGKSRCTKFFFKASVV